MKVNKTIKLIIGVLALTAAHFAVCKTVVALTLALSSSGVDSGALSRFGTTALVATTRILYFPIITLSLYSRRWFPGDLILAPMLANSLLWGIALTVTLWLIKHRMSPS